MSTGRIIPNLSHDEYHERRLGVVSKSGLDHLLRSPAHYKAWVEGQDEEPSDALMFGSAFHCALLEPERYAKVYAVEPEFGDCRFKENRATRDTWRAQHAGATLIDESTAETIAAMVDAVHSHPLAGKMFRDGKSELTVKWTDEETGLPCKCRADYYVERLGMVLDAKSTDDARPDAFKRSIVKYGYHRQDAIYRAGFAAAGAPIQHFLFIAVEKRPPHAVAIYSLDQEAIAKGHVAIRNGIETMARCVASGQWPGYSNSIVTLDLPPWA